MTAWDSFKESVILQGALTIALWGTVIYLIIVGQAVPDILAAAAGSIMTFWFTSKTVRAVSADLVQSVTTIAKAVTPPQG